MFNSRCHRYCLLALIAILGLASAAAAQPQQTQQKRHDHHELRALRPGEFVVREQVVPVNLVFIGYDHNQIDEQALLRPFRRPTVRSSASRCSTVSRAATSACSTASATTSFAGAGRSRTSSSAFLKTPEHRADHAFQDAYNQQKKNVLDVVGPVLYIDAPTVERYLAGHDGDEQRGYTIFFINWYSRRDFQFHVYTKTDEADPDTNYNFGVLRDHAR